jgi:glycine betaine/choline ABC-type transport system substrate-binding protein
LTVNDPDNWLKKTSLGSGGPGFQSVDNADINDRTAADVNGGDGTLDLMDLATLEDAVTSGVWPSYAISAIAG